MGLKIAEIPFVGYPVSDIKRAREFYEGILGLTPGAIDQEIPEMPGKYWIEYESWLTYSCHLQCLGTLRSKRAICSV